MSILEDECLHGSTSKWYLSVEQQNYLSLRSEILNCLNQWISFHLPGKFCFKCWNVNVLLFVLMPRTLCEQCCSVLVMMVAGSMVSFSFYNLLNWTLQQWFLLRMRHGEAGTAQLWGPGHVAPKPQLCSLVPQGWGGTFPLCFRLFDFFANIYYFFKFKIRKKWLTQSGQMGCVVTINSL